MNGSIIFRRLKGLFLIAATAVFVSDMIEIAAKFYHLSISPSIAVMTGVVAALFMFKDEVGNQRRDKHSNKTLEKKVAAFPAPRVRIVVASPEESLIRIGGSEVIRKCRSIRRRRNSTL